MVGAGLALQVVCELCGQAWALKEIAQHTAAHILEDDWSKYGKPKPTIPCMLCGTRDSVGQNILDHSISGCGIFLVKNAAGTMKPKHQCKLVGCDLDYSLKSKENSVCSAPSTNRARTTRSAHPPAIAPPRTSTHRPLCLAACQMREVRTRHSIILDGGALHIGARWRRQDGPEAQGRGRARAARGVPHQAAP